MKVKVIPIVIGILETITKSKLKIKTGKNTEKSPVDQRKLAVTQTPANTDVKNSQSVKW